MAMTTLTPTPDVSAPPADLADIERLVEAYGDAVEQLGRDMEREGARWTDSRPTDATHEALLTAIRQLASAPVAVPADVAKAADELWDRLADLQGEHEVMAGPFDPDQWTLDGIEASHIKAVVEFLCPRAKEALNKLSLGRIAAEDTRQLAISDSMQGFLASCRPHGAVSDAGSVDGKVKSYSHREAVSLGYLCDDCPPPGYPTDETRCAPCPARAAPLPPVGEKAAADATTMEERT